MYVVVTRYVAPKGTVITHTYGLFTKPQAPRKRRRILRTDITGKLEVSACRVLDY